MYILIPSPSAIIIQPKKPHLHESGAGSFPLSSFGRVSAEPEIFLKDLGNGFVVTEKYCVLADSVGLGVVVIFFIEVLYDWH